MSSNDEASYKITAFGKYKYTALRAMGDIIHDSWNAVIDSLVDDVNFREKLASKLDPIDRDAVLKSLVEMKR